MWGISFAKPVLHLREYLEVLVPLSKGEAVDIQAATVTARGALDVPGATPFPVLVAALGTQMLEAHGPPGRRHDHVVRRTQDARQPHHPHAVARRRARRARRSARRGDVPGRASPPIRRRPTNAWRGRSPIYGQLPSYRAMLDREGAEGAADIAILGDEDEITDRIGQLKEIGVTDLGAVPVGQGPRRARAHPRHPAQAPDRRRLIDGGAAAVRRALVPARTGAGSLSGPSSRRRRSASGRS